MDSNYTTAQLQGSHFNSLLLGCLGPGFFISLLYFCCYLTVRNRAKSRSGEGWVQADRLSSREKLGLKQMPWSPLSHDGTANPLFKANAEFGELRKQGIEEYVDHQIRKLKGAQQKQLLAQVVASCEEIFEHCDKDTADYVDILVDRLKLIKK